MKTTKETQTSDRTTTTPTTAEKAPELRKLSLRRLHRYRLEAEDGTIGKIHDTYFDDKSWVIRYLVVDTGSWFSGLRVLVSPSSCGVPDTTHETIPVSMTRRQVRSSPPVELARPVSRQKLVDLHAHFGWPLHWGGDMGGNLLFPGTTQGPGRAEELRERSEQPGGGAAVDTGPLGDEFLRSAREVTGYHIKAKDGSIGHVEDFLAEDGIWTIRYLVVDTRNWLPGRRVIIAPTWIRRIDWPEHRVEVGLTREAVKASPLYVPEELTRAYEEQLHRHYGLRV